jgi:hypothetical protein
MFRRNRVIIRCKTLKMTKHVQCGFIHCLYLVLFNILHLMMTLLDRNM